MKFNMLPSWEALCRYLGSADPYDEIRLTLFQHGVGCVGLPTIEKWREVFRFARRGGRFVGLDEDLYPRDFGALGRYQSEIQEVPSRHPLQVPVPLRAFSDFLARKNGQFAAHWEGLEEPVPV